MAKKYPYTQKTMEFLRKRGFQVDTSNIVERWIPGGPGRPGKRRDFLGIIDIIVCNGIVTIGVQSTGPSGKSEHLKTLRESPNSRLWLEAGNLLWLVWHRKLLKKRGGKLRVWTPGIVEIKLEDLI